MKLYGSEVKQKYIQGKKGKRKFRYPYSEEYPTQAKTQANYNNAGKKDTK